MSIRVPSGSIESETRNRFQVVNVLLVVLFVTLGIRVWFLQIFQGKKFRQFSEENRIELKKIPAMRGKILDRNGQVLAESRASFDVVLTRQYLEENLNETLDRLGKILSWTEAERKKAATKVLSTHPSEEVAIKNDVSRDQLARLLSRQYSFPGVDVVHTPARTYPYGDHGSHVLGYLSEINAEEFKKLKKDPNSNTVYELGDVWGISGVEKKYDLILKGENGTQPYVEDAKGRKIDAKSGTGEFADDLLPAFQRRDPVRGKDLVLTIDSRVQEAAELAFDKDAGAAVAIDPNTGDVLTLLSRPEYSPERFVRGVSSDYWSQLLDDPLNPLYDRALRGLYPPGSTFKFIMGAALLAEKVASAQDVIFCGGSYRLGREVKSCHKKEGHGWMNLHNAIKYSCDVYFYEMGRRLGIENIAKYASGFGLGQPTNVGINREEKGLVPTEEWKRRVYRQPWVGGETLSVAIGQGALQTTPMQMAVALASFVNGGKIVTPRIAIRSQTEDGKPVEKFDVKSRPAIQLDPKIIEAVRNGMVAVVNEPGGTAYWSGRSQSIIIGGKTGTAQTVGRGYGSGKGDHAWFVAFAPADAPKIVVSIILEHSGHGGVVAAPIAKKIIEAYLGETS
jgi:penicillin-binding protein 2